MHDKSSSPFPSFPQQPSFFRHVFLTNSRQQLTHAAHKRTPQLQATDQRTPLHSPRRPFSFPAFLLHHGSHLPSTFGVRTNLLSMPRSVRSHNACYCPPQLMHMPTLPTSTPNCCQLRRHGSPAISMLIPRHHEAIKSHKKIGRRVGDQRLRKGQEKKKGEVSFRKEERIEKSCGGLCIW